MDGAFFKINLSISIFAQSFSFALCILSSVPVNNSGNDHYGYIDSPYLRMIIIRDGHSPGFSTILDPPPPLVGKKKQIHIDKIFKHASYMLSVKSSGFYFL